LPSGTYQRVVPEKDAPRVRSQERFIAFARKRAQEPATPRAQQDAPSGGTTVFLLANPVRTKPPEPELASSRTPPPVLVS
jgi:hypothetical protein